MGLFFMNSTASRIVLPRTVISSVISIYFSQGELLLKPPQVISCGLIKYLSASLKYKLYMVYFALSMSTSINYILRTTLQHHSFSYPSQNQLRYCKYHQRLLYQEEQLPLLYSLNLNE